MRKMDAPYLYDGLEASSYDRVDELADFNDVPFFRLLVDSHPGSVLDLGCGTGRTLVPLVEDGIDVVGLDSSRSMLDICRGKLERLSLESELIQGDMRRFKLERRFASILVPGFSFQMLEKPEDQIACLESCRHHLETGDQLVLPIYYPWEMLESDSDESPMEIRKEALGEEGERVVAWQRWKIDRLGQLLYLENRYQRIDAGGKILGDESRSMTLRWEMPYDMQRLLSGCGYSEVEMYGDFEMRPPESDSESIIFVARP